MSASTTVLELAEPSAASLTVDIPILCCSYDYRLIFGDVIYFKHRHGVMYYPLVDWSQVILVFAVYEIISSVYV